MIWILLNVHWHEILLKLLFSLLMDHIFVEAIFRIFMILFENKAIFEKNCVHIFTVFNFNSRTQTKSVIESLHNS